MGDIAFGTGADHRPGHREPIGALLAAWAPEHLDPAVRLLRAEKLSGKKTKSPTLLEFRDPGIHRRREAVAMDVPPRAQVPQEPRLL